MNYQEYMSGVERRRMLLRQKLEQANTLRREARMPTRDIDKAVTEQEPLLTKQHYDAQLKQQQGFRSFRKQRMAQVKLDRPGSEADWQQHRALVFRRAFVEQQIKVAWALRDPRSRNSSGIAV